jgi:hypothetical protein
MHDSNVSVGRARRMGPGAEVERAEMERS